MDDMTGMADNLLDFENSIQSQMEASVLLGRQLNFDKARQLALEGDLKGAADEVLKQVGTASDFNKLNIIQKKAVAKAAGLEVGQLEQALIRKEEMAMLTREEKMEILRREKLLGNLNEISIVDFDHSDVVRHPLVSKIVKAYSDKDHD